MRRTGLVERHMTGCDDPLREQLYLVEEDSGNSNIDTNDINEMHINHEKYIVVGIPEPKLLRVKILGVHVRARAHTTFDSEGQFIKIGS